jgi:hypothetical protein
MFPSFVARSSPQAKQRGSAILLAAPQTGQKRVEIIVIFPFQEKGIGSLCLFVV